MLPSEVCSPGADHTPQVIWAAISTSAQPQVRGGEAREPESADHDEAFARHGGATRIDVERGTAPGSEGEIPARDGVLPQELAEAALEGWDGRRCHMIVVAVATTTVNLSGELRA